MATPDRDVHSFRKYFQQTLSPQHGDVILLLCYTITGLLDSSAAFIWGAFVSMQTGNTVYLGLGLAGADSTRWIRSGISIASFCLGSIFFGWFYRQFPARRRWVLCTSFALQTIFIIAAAVIVTVTHPGQDLEWQTLVSLGLVAFQSSGQAVTSRVLQYPGLTSVVLTSVYCDFFSNPQLLSRKIWTNVEERRRAAAIVCLVAGTMIGGGWARNSIGLPGALWTAAALKAAIVFAWMGWREERIAL